jgi:hypothetical protein
MAGMLLFFSKKAYIGEGGNLLLVLPNAGVRVTAKLALEGAEFRKTFTKLEDTSGESTCMNRFALLNEELPNAPIVSKSIMPAIWSKEIFVKSVVSLHGLTQLALFKGHWSVLLSDFCVQVNGLVISLTNAFDPVNPHVSASKAANINVELRSVTAVGALFNASIAASTPTTPDLTDAPGLD